MTHDESDIIGKNVKDMYGTFMGKVAGTITDIDGTIQSAGIDCGTQGLMQIPYEQLVVQKDVVIFISKWRLDSQRLIREKQLTLRRLRALVDIVSENGNMKDDADLIHEKYKSKLATLDETESQIKAELEERLSDLEEQTRSAKMLLFDANVQSKSNEIPNATFEKVKECTSNVMERITHEQAEISSIKGRISDLALEREQITSPQQQDIQESAVSYLETSEPQQAVQAILPEAPTEPVPIPDPIGARAIPAVMPAEMPAEVPTESGISSNLPDPPQQVSKAKGDAEGDWLARMGAQ